MPFRRLDRYLARSFVEPFLIALAVIVGLYIVGDAFGNLDDYLREAQGFFRALGRMAWIYALRTPAFLVPVFPIAMLIGAAYGIAHLSVRNEITAMKASGISFWRVLAPIYAMAILAAALAMANREWLVPRVEDAAASDMQTWKGKADRYDQAIGFIENESTFYEMKYNAAKRDAQRLFVSKDPPGGAIEYFVAGKAHPVKGGWMVDDIQSGVAPEGGVWRTSLRPRDVELHLQPPESRSVTELRKFIPRVEDRQRRVFVFHYHEHLAYPFMGIVLVALGVPFVIGHERVQRSRMLGIGVCVGICMVFYTVQFVTKDLGLTGRLPPAVAAWLPNVIFGGTGLYLLESVHN